MTPDTKLYVQLLPGETSPYVYLRGRTVGLRVLSGEVEVSVGDDNIIPLEASQQDTEAAVMTRTSLDVSEAQHQVRSTGLTPAMLEISIVPPLEEGTNPYVK